MLKHKEQGSLIYHLFATITVCIWGTTFVSTKILIDNGLNPQEIFLLRFIMAYIGIWLIAPKKFFAYSLKDEAQMLLCGLAGGSVYFLTENTALETTTTTNVSFIVCTTPIITALLMLIFNRKQQIRKSLAAGSIIALVGVSFLIFNGCFVLEISPLGDFLSLMAALSWACYSIVVNHLSKRYPSAFLTRKVFFYGLITALPLFIVHPWNFSLDCLAVPVIWTNLIFLGVIASLMCFISWNYVLKNLGTIETSNYLYLNPLSTTICAYFILNERPTVYSVAGAILVLSGLFIASGQYKRKRSKANSIRA